MPSSHSIANVDVDIGGFRFPVRVMSISKEVTLDTREVCVKHRCAVDYNQRCGECNFKVKQAALGTRAPRPTKQSHCTNPKCGAALKGNTKSKPFCPTCERVLKAEEVADAYPFADRLILLTEAERSALLALRQERGIKVLRVLQINQQPSVRYFRGPVRQLLPDISADERSALAFEAFRDAACKQALTFAAFSTLKEENEHMTFVHEHGALLRCEPDGTILLVPLLGQHEVDVMPMPIYVPEERWRGHLLQMKMVMAKLQQALSDPINTVDLKRVLATPAARSLHKLIQAKVLGVPCGVEMDDPGPDQFVSLIETLRAQMEQTLPARQKRRRGGRSRGANVESAAV